MSDPLSMLANAGDDDDDNGALNRNDDAHEQTAYADQQKPEDNEDKDGIQLGKNDEQLLQTDSQFQLNSSQHSAEEPAEHIQNQHDMATRQSSNMSDNSDILAKIEEEMENGPKDLDVAVDNPEKIVKTMESYVAFTVKTKTTRSDFEDPEYSVKRRYNDFLWLRQQLEEKNPMLIIPPLPEKHSMTIDRFDTEFVNFRKVALHRFMTRLALHPTLSKDETVKAFLTLDVDEFQVYKKRGVGLLSRMTKSLSTKGTSMMLKNRSEEHSKLFEYAQALGQKMGAFERISTRVTGEQNDYLLALSGFTPALTDWASGEDDLSSTLLDMAKLMSIVHDDLQEMVNEAALETTLRAKEYVLFSDAIKNALTRRDASQYELEVVTEELVKCSEQKQQLESGAPGAGGFLSRSNTEEAIHAKTDKVSSRITELESAHNHLKSKLVENNLLLQTDLERWHINKKADMKELISGMASRNIDTYDKHINSLETTLKHLKENMTS